jgi:hypothetical protein
MNKLILSLSLAAMTAFSTASYALDKSIALYAGSGEGGLQTIFQTVIAEELGKRGWDVDFKVIGNCGQVSNMLDTTDKPMMAGWGNSWNVPGNVCNRPPVAANFIETIVTSPRLLCGPLGDTDFALVPGNKYLIGVNANQGHEVILAALGKKIGVEFKFIPYKNSGAILKAIQAKEIDAWYTTRGLTENNTGKQKCVYGTLTAPAFGIIPLNTLFDTDNVYSSFTGYLTTNDKFSPELREALKKDVFEIVHSAEYAEQLVAKSSYLDDLDTDSQIDAIIASSRAYVQ